jgi:hypothetical protein
MGSVWTELKAMSGTIILFTNGYRRLLVARRSLQPATHPAHDPILDLIRSREWMHPLVPRPCLDSSLEFLSASLSATSLLAVVETLQHGDYGKISSRGTKESMRVLWFHIASGSHRHATMRL